MGSAWNRKTYRYWTTVGSRTGGVPSLPPFLYISTTLSLLYSVETLRSLRVTLNYITSGVTRVGGGSCSGGDSGSPSGTVGGSGRDVGCSAEAWSSMIEAIQYIPRWVSPTFFAYGSSGRRV